MGNFHKDLSAGIETEHEFIAFLFAHEGVKAERNTSTSLIEQRFYDVSNEFGVTYEIKRDRHCVVSGNVYLEVKALTASKAEFVVYKLDVDNHFYILDKQGVLEMLENSKYKTVKGGDVLSLGVLVPLNKFRKEFKVMNTVNDTVNAKYKKKSKIQNQYKTPGFIAD